MKKVDDNQVQDDIQEWCVDSNLIFEFADVWICKYGTKVQGYVVILVKCMFVLEK